MAAPLKTGDRQKNKTYRDQKDTQAHISCGTQHCNIFLLRSSYVLLSSEASQEGRRGLTNPVCTLQSARYTRAKLTTVACATPTLFGINSYHQLQTVIYTISLTSFSSFIFTRMAHGPDILQDVRRRGGYEHTVQKRECLREF